MVTYVQLLCSNSTCGHKFWAAHRHLWTLMEKIYTQTQKLISNFNIKTFKINNAILFLIYLLNIRFTRCWVANSEHLIRACIQLSCICDYHSCWHGVCLWLRNLISFSNEHFQQPSFATLLNWHTQFGEKTRGKINSGCSRRISNQPDCRSGEGKWVETQTWELSQASCSAALFSMCDLQSPLALTPLNHCLFFAKETALKDNCIFLLGQLQGTDREIYCAIKQLYIVKVFYLCNALVIWSMMYVCLHMHIMQ